MSVLSDKGMKEAQRNGDIYIQPWVEESIQPASLDVRLGRYLRVPRTHSIEVYDPESPPPECAYDVIDLEEGSYPLKFGNFVLGATLEKVFLGSNHTAHIDGISSLGRLGLMIHSGSCWIDPGFIGTITLELSVGSNTPVLLRAGMRIGQLVIEEVTPPTEKLYGDKSLGSKYQGQLLPGYAKKEKV